MCFMPQQCAPVQHLNFKKWSEPVVFFNILTSKFASPHHGVRFFSTSQFPKAVQTCGFLNIWLAHVCRATTARTFSKSQLPKVGRACSVFMCFEQFDFKMCFAPHWRALFSTSQLPKVGRECSVLRHLTSKACTFWTSELPKVGQACSLFEPFDFKGVHFFDIWTSKSGLNVQCFEHFDFKTRFVPQLRALFRYLNLQTWSGRVLFCTFWLPHVLRATVACTFPHRKMQKVSKSGPNLRCF